MTRAFNLADLFEIVVDAVPRHLALVAGATRLTFRELDERADRVAHHLAAAGVGPGDHVSILAYNRAEWIEAQIGAYKLRAVPVNVNYRYTADELAYVIADSESVALIGERSLIARLGGARAGLGHLRHVVVVEDGSDEDVPDAVRYEDALAAASTGRDYGERSGDDLYLLYTGGTTGMPKGVMWRSEDIFMSAMFGGNLMGDPVAAPEEMAGKALEGGVTTMVCAPMMHGAGMWVAWIALTSGSTLVLWTGRTFDTGAVLSAAVAEKAQSMLLVGDAMARPIADELAARPGAHDLSQLLVIGTGGAATSPDVKRRLHELIPSLLAVLDAFGGSETGASGQAVEPAADGSPRFMPRGADVAVLDESLRRIEPGSGAVGQLARTGRIPLGYWKDEAKTARTFVIGADGERWALQGDMGRVDADGSIILLGRGSLVINTGGEKVFVEEVEATLKTHPAVYDALVVGVPDERLGARVAAAVSLAGPASDPSGEAAAGATAGGVGADELIAHCRAVLAGFKVPREIRVVAEVQRSPAGKADYRWARGLYAPDGDGA
ncbi:acyl-CoA synthetase [Actinomadura xylanilytica]|uniref:acyl-CoA synthetase n=1 Tax=Actinomadura xylanilytica TaxID=887459 RepID=UPI00255A8CB7|nr:acyl-CoA synthetase [Actinomadura xylanilytica]MDL4773272.1 acyl-CoA synthetase [Actinomadura xylanilytica]